MELINKDNKDISDALLEQYKLYVEMMDKVSERRGNANSFFITLPVAWVLVCFKKQRSLCSFI